MDTQGHIMSLMHERLAFARKPKLKTTNVGRGKENVVLR